MQFANILFNDFYLCFVYFSFLLLACFSVNLSVSSLSAKPLSNHFALLYRVRSQWRGGRRGGGGGGPHCVKKRILNSFCNLNIVGCLPLKELYKEGRGPGVTGIPGPLVPNLAPV